VRSGRSDQQCYTYKKATHHIHVFSLHIFLGVHMFLFTLPQAFEESQALLARQPSRPNGPHRRPGNSGVKQRC
jgi:hypothetical protein